MIFKYNSVKLHQDHWCLKMYIWHYQLTPTKIPYKKVIKTLIYGIKTRCNQVEHALEETAKLSQLEYVEVIETIMKDSYVDDCVSKKIQN